MSLRKLVPSLIWFCLLCALVFAHGRLMALAEGSLPDAVHVRFKNSMTVNEYLTQKQRNEAACIGFAEEYATVAIPVSSAEKDVKIIAAESSFLELSGLRLLKGSYFMEGTDNSVIMSDSLAGELYLTTDIIGAAIEIDGYKYGVCGVYELERSMTSQLSRNGMDYVYIPLRSDVGRLAAVDNILVKVPPATDLNAYSADQIRKLVNSGDEVKESINYSEILAIARQSGRLKWFFIALVAGIAIFAVALSRARLLWRFIHNIWISRQKTFRDEVKNIILQAMLCVGLVLCGIVLMRIASFQPTLPMRIVGNGNSFSLSFYTEMYTEIIQRLNSDGTDFWMRFSYRALTGLYLADLCVLAAAVGLIHGLWKLLYK